MSEILKAVLDDARGIYGGGRLVKIDEEKLAGFKMPTGEETYWLSKVFPEILESDERTVTNFLLRLEAIDFSFWSAAGEKKWTVTVGGKTFDGSAALVHGLWEFKDLEFLAGIPLEKERREILATNERILEKTGKDFYDLMAPFKTDSEIFEMIIKTFPSFRSRFYKLAQLLTADIINVRNLKRDEKESYENLIGCAGYKIPQVLRATGILKYAPELCAKIDNFVEIEAGSAAGNGNFGGDFSRDFGIKSGERTDGDVGERLFVYDGAATKSDAAVPPHTNDGVLNYSTPVK